MFEHLAREAGKSLWKELGEEAAKRAVGTFVGEGIKAVIDIWKTRHIKEMDLEFRQRQKEVDAAQKAANDAPGDEKPGDEKSGDQKSSDEKSSDQPEGQG